METTLTSCLASLRKIKLLLEGLAEETAVAVDDDKIERMLTIAGAFDHLLEDRSAIIAGGRTRFDELSDNLVVLSRGTTISIGCVGRELKDRAPPAGPSRRACRALPVGPTAPRH